MSPCKLHADENDCYAIVKELEQVAHKWHNLGLALGLSPSTLENIKMVKGQTADVYELLTNIILEWLKMNHDIDKFGKPTWRRIVEAVRAKSGGGNPALADTLARKYSGKNIQRSIQYILNCSIILSIKVMLYSAEL